MKAFPILTALLLLPAVALAGAAHDACLQEEKELRAQEAAKCHGFRYIIDPSGCFATQRALKEYDSGKCAEIGGNQEKQPEAPAPPAPVPAPAVPQIAPAPPAPPAAQKAEEKGAPVAAEPLDECARLRAENEQLKAELARLRTEVERLGQNGAAR